MAATAPQIATANERRSRGNSWSAMDSELGIIAALPMPCSTRAPMRTSTFGVMAHRIDPVVNRPRPPRNTRLPPMRSAARPAARSSAAAAIA